jgi:hypothetical protein
LIDADGPYDAIQGRPAVDLAQDSERGTDVERQASSCLADKVVVLPPEGQRLTFNARQRYH